MKVKISKEELYKQFGKTLLGALPEIVFIEAEPVEEKCGHTWFPSLHRNVCLKCHCIQDTSEPKKKTQTIDDYPGLKVLAELIAEDMPKKKIEPVWTTDESDPEYPVKAMDYDKTIEVIIQAVNTLLDKQEKYERS